LRKQIVKSDRESKVDSVKCQYVHSALSLPCLPSLNIHILPRSPAPQRPVERFLATIRVA
jgi:hypothetical protein